MYKRLLFCLLILGVVVAGGSMTTSQPSAIAQESVFETTDCGFYVPAGQKVECGYLTVPEDHSQPDGRTIRLHVAIFKSLSETPEADPVIYLTGGPAGGPGSNESSTITITMESDYAVFLDHRDLILIDQRGTGYSEPKLDCRAWNQFPVDTISRDLTAEEVITLKTDLLNACSAEYQGQGVNLAAYNTANIAADLNDLRLAMGYESWNLYAVGYGTRFALTMMRDYPEGLRSVILDSPIPPQADWISDMPANIVYSLETLFANCAADIECNTDYPELGANFYETVARLEAEPVTLTVAHPFTQEEFGMVLDGTRYLNTIRWAFYHADNIQFLPYIIDSAYHNSFQFVGLFAEQLLTTPGFLSEVMQYSLLCSEAVPFSSRDTFAAQVSATPDVAQDYLSIDGTIAFNVCEAWDLPTSVRAHDPITSDIPTLVLGSTYDGVAPPPYADMTAETLSNSYLYIFPANTHNLVYSLDICPLLVTSRFINNPTTDPAPDCYAAEGGVNFVSRIDMVNLQREIMNQ